MLRPGTSFSAAIWSKATSSRRTRYVLLTDEDFDSVKVESSSVMTVEKFVDAGSIDPMYYDASYFVAPDGKAGTDVYAVLREAIAKTGKTALARVVISQRERTVALRPMGEGLMAHTLHEDRDLNSPKELFDELSGVKVDPEMVQLATQLIQRQAGKYDPGDLEDRYETRLRAMIDAKLKGEGISAAEAPAAVNECGRPNGGAERKPRAWGNKPTAGKKTVRQAASKPVRKRA